MMRNSAPTINYSLLRDSQEYTPTGFDKVKSVQEVNKHHVEFVIWDTSGKWKWKRLINTEISQL